MLIGFGRLLDCLALRGATSVIGWLSMWLLMIMGTVGEGTGVVVVGVVVRRSLSDSGRANISHEIDPDLVQGI
jgi:hypothetical protein